MMDKTEALISLQALREVIEQLPKDARVELCTIGLELRVLVSDVDTIVTLAREYPFDVETTKTGDALMWVWWEDVRIECVASPRRALIHWAKAARAEEAA